jgi:hypothetical protein
MKLFCNEFTKLTLHRRQTPHAAQTGGMGGARGSRSQTRLSTVTLNGPSDRGRFSNRQSSQGTHSLTILLDDESTLTPRRRACGSARDVLRVGWIRHVGFGRALTSASRQKERSESSVFATVTGGTSIFDLSSRA